MSHVVPMKTIHRTDAFYLYPPGWMLWCRSCVPCSQTQSSCPTSIVRWAPKLEDVCRSISNDPRDHHRRITGTCFNWVSASFPSTDGTEKTWKNMKTLTYSQDLHIIPPKKMDPCDVWSLWHFRSLRMAGRLLCLRLHFIENDCVDIDDYVALGSIFQLVSDGSSICTTSKQLRSIRSFWI